MTKRSGTALKFIFWGAVAVVGTVAADWALVGLWEVGKWIVRLS